MVVILKPAAQGASRTSSAGLGSGEAFIGFDTLCTFVEPIGRIAQVMFSRFDGLACEMVAVLPASRPAIRRASWQTQSERISHRGPGSRVVWSDRRTWTTGWAEPSMQAAGTNKPLFGLFGRLRQQRKRAHRERPGAWRQRDCWELEGEQEGDGAGRDNR
jgi:hypothetical protein